LFEETRLSLTDKDCKGCTPLHHAAKQGNIELIDLILNSISKQEGEKLFTMIDKDGNTPFAELVSS